jgi:hypothetical protein
LDDAVLLNGEDWQSALTGFETRVHFVDDVNAAFAANQTVVAVTSLKRFQRILDLHFTIRTVAREL